MLFTETELPGAVTIDLDLHSDNGFQTLTDDVASVVINALSLPRIAKVTDINIRPFAKTI
jgi:hypothetical protein